MARSLLALACALFCACAAAQDPALGEAAVFDLDAPAVRKALERAAVMEAGRGADVELAASLYCRAARFGSLEATYRLGRMILAGRGMPRNLAMAATLFSIAAANGHYGASRMLLLTGVQEDRLPPCLGEPQGK